MESSRTKNAVRNIIWGMIERITALLIPFICRTVFIKILGAEYLGLGSLFTSILSVLSISELGFGTAIVFSMYQPIAEDDNDTVCALLNAYRKIYKVVGTVILAVGLMIMPFVKFLVKGDCPPDVNIYILYAIFLANTVLSYFLYAYKAALFSAYQRNDLASKRNALINMLANILQIVVLLVFKNYYCYIIIMPCMTMVTNITNAVLAKKMFPQIVCRGQISSEMKQGIKRRITGLLSFKIYGIMFTSVDTLVISSFLGLTQLAIYNNYYYIQTSIIAFMNIFTASITAGIGNKMVTNSVEDNYKDFKRCTFLNAWLCSWCAVCLFCLYQPFMNLWMGEKLMFDFPMMALMVAYFFLPRVTAMTFTYREAAGLWYEDRFRPLIAAVVNLGLNIWWVHYIGMYGIILSTLFCTVFINIPWGTYILFKNYFKRSPMEYALQLLCYMLVAAIACVISIMVSYMLHLDGMLNLMVTAAVCVVVPNLIFWLCYRNMPEFTFMEEMLSRVYKMVKNFRR